MMAAPLVFFFLARLAQMGHSDSEADVRKIKSTRKKQWPARRKGVRARQVGANVRKANRQSGTKGRHFSHRLIEHVGGGFLVGDFRLGCFRHLIAAAGAGRNRAVSEQKFGLEQADLLARPVNPVAETIRKINLSSSAGAHQMSAFVIEPREMPADYVVPSRTVMEISRIANPAGNYRVGIRFPPGARNMHNARLGQQSKTAGVEAGERVRQEI